MFAFQARAETVIRIALISVILANALAPTGALANPGTAPEPITHDNNQNDGRNDADGFHGRQAAEIPAIFDQLPICFVPNVGQEDGIDLGRGINISDLKPKAAITAIWNLRNSTAS